MEKQKTSLKRVDHLVEVNIFNHILPEDFSKFLKLSHFVI